ncbi:GAF domain-containing protein [Bacteroides coprosuis DSM 18011]|uniref:GAF domain-containing protein n=1 Tax=Bacteroides coprosuis DSM 18011 TaxID=679937 RepID=F3ZUR8_9BACE|nr:GAF domain-containing protein [Bacteroides coprosuis]EGJ71378.1 GAF domain-containing protein [Bacteroides coprosuis DSM 18011]
MTKLTKKERYESLLSQIKGLVEGESNQIANMANVVAAIFAEFKFHWVGFYLVEGDELVLGPFQGPVACTRITKGKGVCGTAWETGKVQIVDDVHEFPGHIACSAYSLSEIVIPIYSNNKIIGVLDIDSDTYSSFSNEDELYLSAIMSLFLK